MLFYFFCNSCATKSVAISDSHGISVEFGHNDQVNKGYYIEVPALSKFIIQHSGSRTWLLQLEKETVKRRAKADKRLSSRSRKRTRRKVKKKAL